MGIPHISPYRSMRRISCRHYDGSVGYDYGCQKVSIAGMIIHLNGVSSAEPQAWACFFGILRKHPPTVRHETAREFHDRVASTSSLPVSVIHDGSLWLHRYYRNHSHGSQSAQKAMCEAFAYQPYDCSYHAFHPFWGHCRVFPEPLQHQCHHRFPHPSYHGWSQPRRP